ncbi:MAG TPA: molybdenum cofactor guanylyltransferase [Bacilli bacterium]|nr:molybdenum cofactor guanylyltransferase [Bacilli bacterium]
MKTILLCGGSSSRMGRPKQWLPLGGRPLLLQTLETIRPICHDRVVITNDPDEAVRIREVAQVPTCPDEFPGQGPLAGLHAGLQDVPQDGIALLVACDLPFLHTEVLRDLCDLLAADPQLEAAVPQEGTRLFPVCAVYRGSVRDRAARHLAQGQNALRKFLAELNVAYVPTERWAHLKPSPFFNMNTPQAYEEVLDLYKKEGFTHDESSISHGARLRR